jgi:hypothetical protein
MHQHESNTTQERLLKILPRRKKEKDSKPAMKSRMAFALLKLRVIHYA